MFVCVCAERRRAQLCGGDLLTLACCLRRLHLAVELEESDLERLSTPQQHVLRALSLHAQDSLESASELFLSSLSSSDSVSLSDAERVMAQTSLTDCAASLSLWSPMPQLPPPPPTAITELSLLQQQHGAALEATALALLRSPSAPSLVEAAAARLVDASLLCASAACRSRLLLEARLLGLSVAPQLLAPSEAALLPGQLEAIEAPLSCWTALLPLLSREQQQQPLREETAVLQLAAATVARRRHNPKLSGALLDGLDGSKEAVLLERGRLLGQQQQAVSLLPPLEMLQMPEVLLQCAQWMQQHHQQQEHQELVRVFERAHEMCNDALQTATVSAAFGVFCARSANRDPQHRVEQKEESDKERQLRQRAVMELVRSLCARDDESVALELLALLQFGLKVSDVAAASDAVARVPARSWSTMLPQLLALLSPSVQHQELEGQAVPMLAARLLSGADLDPLQTDAVLFRVAELWLQDDVENESNAVFGVALQSLTTSLRERDATRCDRVRRLVGELRHVAVLCVSTREAPRPRR